METKEVSYKKKGLKEGEGVINDLTTIISEKVNLFSYMSSTDIFPLFIIHGFLCAGHEVHSLSSVEALS